MPNVSIFRVCLALLALGAGPTRADVVEEVVKVPVSVRDVSGWQVSQDIVVTILRDRAIARAPLLILSHGRGPDRETMPRASFPRIAKLFVAQGYVVVMPTRIGYGPSGGRDVETSGRGCDRAEFGPGFRVAADETQQVIDWAAKRDDVAPP
jgi:predicted acyl esterase